MFSENSGLVKLWVRSIQKGNYERKQVPNLSNLQDVVYGILDRAENKEP